MRCDQVVAAVLDDTDRRPVETEKDGNRLREPRGERVGVARNGEEGLLQGEELLQPEYVEQGRIGYCESRRPDTFLLLHGERWM